MALPLGVAPYPSALQTDALLPELSNRLIIKMVLPFGRWQRGILLCCLTLLLNYERMRLLPLCGKSLSKHNKEQTPSPSLDDGHRYFTVERFGVYRHTSQEAFTRF